MIKTDDAKHRLVLKDFFLCLASTNCVMASGSSSQSAIAQKTWEMANQITPEEEVYKFDRNQHQSILSAKPWSKDPHFFKDIKISALALLKMVMHAR